ncbi:MAG: carbohydrate binding domain-containing protein [Lacipirellulaceae bacterium]
MKSLLQLTRAIGLALLATTSSAVELTTNGGFETGDTSGWVSFPTATSTFNLTGDANSGSFAAEVFNNTSTSGAVVKQANLGVGVVTPGEMVTISFAAKGEGAAGGVAFAEFFSELDGGGVSSAVILGGAPLVLTNQYQTFNFSVLAGPNVSGGVTLQFAAVTGAASGSVSVLFIDDASVSVIPEPGTALLASLALAAVPLRRRARN